MGQIIKPDAAHALQRGIVQIRLLGISFLACAWDVDLNARTIRDGEHGRNGCGFKCRFL
jgi:hypothetical protein